MTELREFSDFELAKDIKTSTLDLIEETNKIYNIMEGLHILTNFALDEKTGKFFTSKLREFFTQEYPDPKRFNLVRHFRLLPSLCRYASHISRSDEKDFWTHKSEEILYLILGTQNTNGSWGYFPRSFSYEQIQNSPIKKSWNELSRESQNELSAKCVRMRDYYVETVKASEAKASDSIVWTAYSLTTLMSSSIKNCEALNRGITYLLKQQDKSGGWGFNTGDPTNISATCIVLVTLFTAFSENELDTRNESVLRKALQYIVNFSFR